MERPGEYSIDPLEGHARVVVLENLLEGGALQGHAVGAGLAHAETMAPAPAVEDPAALDTLSDGEPAEDVVLEAQQAPDMHAAHPMQCARGIHEREILDAALVIVLSR